MNHISFLFREDSYRIGLVEVFINNLSGSGACTDSSFISTSSLKLGIQELLNSPGILD